MSVVEAVERDLAAMPAVAESALAAAARVLAVELDESGSCEECGAAVLGNSGQTKAQVARALRETLDRLRELAPAADDKDRLDELTARRTKRLGRSAP